MRAMSAANKINYKVLKILMLKEFFLRLFDCAIMILVMMMMIEILRPNSYRA